jgi:hypothetical protein
MARKIKVQKFGADDRRIEDILTADHYIVVEGGVLAVRDSLKNNVKVYQKDAWLECEYVQDPRL